MFARLSTPFVTLLAAAVPCAGCNSLSPLEKQQYQNLICQGAEPVAKKKPTLAAILNIGPGIGDLYNTEYGAFVLDLLLWWPSVAWAVPQGAITARNTNKKATIAHYSVGPGKGRFDPDKPCQDPTHGHASPVVAAGP